MEKPQAGGFSALTSQTDIEDRKARAKAWFESLRDRLCAEFEAIEDSPDTPLAVVPVGRFVRTAW